MRSLLIIQLSHFDIGKTLSCPIHNKLAISFCAWHPIKDFFILFTRSFKSMKSSPINISIYCLIFISHKIFHHSQCIFLCLAWVWDLFGLNTIVLKLPLEESMPKTILYQKKKSKPSLENRIYFFFSSWLAPSYELYFGSFPLYSMFAS